MKISQADAYILKRPRDRDWNRFPLPQAAYLSCFSAKPSKAVFVSTGSSTKAQKEEKIKSRACILTPKANTLSGFQKSEMEMDNELKTNNLAIYFRALFFSPPKLAVLRHVSFKIVHSL